MSTFSALFLFAGIGAGALGFLNARMTTHGAAHRFVSIGGVDNDPVACRDFERLTKSPALCADLTTMTAAELRAFAGEMLRTLAIAAAGAFMLSGTHAVWVRPRRDGSYPLYAEAKTPRRRRKARAALVPCKAPEPCAVVQMGGVQ